MFKEIAPVVALGNITLAISASKDGGLQVAFIQKPAEGNKVPIPPRCWTGTPEELDACVVPELAELIQLRTTTIADGLAEAKKTMEDAMAAEKEAAKNRATKSTKPGVTKVVPAAGTTKAQPSLNAAGDDHESDDDDGGPTLAEVTGGEVGNDGAPPEVASLVAAASSNSNPAGQQSGGLFD